MEQLETETVIARDRERLTQARQEAEQRIQAAQDALADIERRFKAIEAFEAALRNVRKEQEPARPAKSGRAKKSPPKAERASRGERQQQLYEIIRGKPGITAAEIVAQLGADGKEGNAIRAALFKMKKAGRVEVEGKGKYSVVPQACAPPGFRKPFPVAPFLRRIRFRATQASAVSAIPPRSASLPLSLGSV